MQIFGLQNTKMSWNSISLYFFGFMRRVNKLYVQFLLINFQRIISTIEMVLSCVIKLCLGPT